MKYHFLFRRLEQLIYLIAVIAIIVFISHTTPAFGGKLRDFEEDVTEEREEEKPRRYYRDEEEEKSGFWGTLFKILFSGLVESDRDDRRPRDSYSIPREPEFREPSYTPAWDRPYNPALLSSFRLDANYQAVESDVQALDARAELGFRSFGIQGRFTHYYEDHPPDKLNLIQIHALYRTLLLDQLEIDVGVGTSILDGEDRNYDFSLTTPVLLYPRNSVGIEFRPSWSWVNDIDDYDLGIVFNASHVALRLGYRWVKSAHESLDGPYLGCSFRF